MGWTPLFATDDVLFFQVGHGLLLSMFDAQKLADDSGFADPAHAFAQEPGRMTLGHNMASEAEVDSEIAKAEAAGGTVLKPPQHAFWGGYYGFVADPDGFVWEIAHNPGLVFGADGVVSFTDG